MNLSITDIQVFPSGLAIKWNDEKDSFVEYNQLRDNCPCAHCSGESDVFGTVYKGPKVKKIEIAYQLKNVIKIGHYAIKITWGDGHNDGIFTFDLIRKFDLSE